MPLSAAPLAAKRLSQIDRVLAALQEGTPAGVTSEKLAEICIRFGGRIFDLRARGWNIETVPLEGTESVAYVLKGTRPLNQPDMLLPAAPAKPSAGVVAGLCDCGHTIGSHAHGTGACMHCGCYEFTNIPKDNDTLF